MEPKKILTLQDWDTYLKALAEDTDSTPDGDTLERAVTQTIADLKYRGLPDDKIEQELHRIFS
jgi:hypothetical protein